MLRTRYLGLIEERLASFRIVGLLGSRQVGKTTLARDFCNTLPEFRWSTHYFDLEDPTALRRLDDPKLALESLKGLVVIDEVQRKPELFPVLRFLVDRPENQMRLLVLGSASRQMIRQSSESLAGRISYLEIHPFSISEVGTDSQQSLWLRGGYPSSFLAKSDNEASVWLSSFIRTYLEQDIPNLGITIPADTIRRFWMMLVHNHGNVLNTAELARSFGVADTTARRYLDILSGTFMVRQLYPYFANIKKRQVKSPKIYFRDSGLLHRLMGVDDFPSLTTHIKCGASWEGFALEQVLRRKEAAPEDCYFWGVHEQGEIDLLIQSKGKLHGFEFKYSSAPGITKSMKLALKTLPLEGLTIVAPVAHSYPLADRIVVSPLSELS